MQTSKVDPLSPSWSGIRRMVLPTKEWSRENGRTGPRKFVAGFVTRFVVEDINRLMQVYEQLYIFTYTSIIVKFLILGRGFNMLLLLSEINSCFREARSTGWSLISCWARSVVIPVRVVISRTEVCRDRQCYSLLQSDPVSACFVLRMTKQYILRCLHWSMCSENTSSVHMCRVFLSLQDALIFLNWSVLQIKLHLILQLQ